MREVIGNLQALGYVSDFDTVEISFKLVNRFDQPVVVQTEQQNFTKNTTFTTTTNSYGEFSIELFENSNINKDTFYSLSIADNKLAQIKIPKGDTSVDILCLINQIDYDGILTVFDTVSGETYVFDESFIELFSMYIQNKKVDLKRNQRKMIEKFISIADIPQENRCDDVIALDQYLGSL